MSSPAKVLSFLTSFPPLSKVTLSSPSPSSSKPAESFSTVSETSMYNGVSQKCTHLQFALPSSGLEISTPRKKIKRVLTTTSAILPDEMEDLHSHDMLQLAWASHDIFTAYLQFHCLSVKEFDIMHAIATNEYEQAEVFLKKADWQIGEIKHVLDSEEVGLLEQSMLSFGLSGKEPSGSDNDKCPSDEFSVSCSNY
ncbi:hypothetical protein J3R83DRAFT_7197 [Lanmaoa asiatica]|nr:hypothetical protein J3R83DRAFT_7197 [Lanmaoa asiatica]